jgi:hypothetical protein
MQRRVRVYWRQVQLVDHHELQLEAAARQQLLHQNLPLQRT